jgi:hypothetical protein
VTRVLTPIAWLLAPGTAAAQAISAAPAEPRAAAAPVVLEHLEAPKEIALGTMALRVWAVLRQEGGSASITGADLRFGEGADAQSVPLDAVDGAFDSPVEEAVGTVDTYTWVQDGQHRWELSATTELGAPAVVSRGTIRVKSRISTPDLLLFDARGTAQPWIGSGAGGFAPSDPLESGLPAFAPCLTDADRDGLVDFVAPSEHGRVRIWKNRGSGRFEVLRTLEIGREAVCAAFGDLDADGRADLVTATARQTLEVRRGLSDDPDFAASLTLAPEHLALTDLTGDGRAEICLALLGLAAGEIQVWTEAENGSYTPGLRLEAPPEGRGRIRQLVPGRDGKGLLVVAEEGGQAVLESWVPPADTKTVSVPECRARYRVPGEPVQVVAGRFSQETRWAAAVREGPGAALYGIREPAELVVLAVLPGVPDAVGVLDLDGDGDDDLVTGGNELRLWINVRGEELREAGESPYLLDSPVVALACGNLDERGS